MPALPSWLTEPLWDQFAALLPAREIYVCTHPWAVTVAGSIAYNNWSPDPRDWSPQRQRDWLRWQP